MKKGLIGLSVFVFLFCSILPLYAQSDVMYETAGQTDRPGGEVMIADLLVVRPFGVVALVLGAGMSILATPFILATGGSGKVYERLVEEPFRFTVTRPLGEF